MGPSDAGIESEAGAGIGEGVEPTMLTMLPRLRRAMREEENIDGIGTESDLMGGLRLNAE